MKMFIEKISTKFADEFVTNCAVDKDAKISIKYRWIYINTVKIVSWIRMTVLDMNKTRFSS